MDLKIKIKKNKDVAFLLAYIPIYILSCCTVELFKVEGLSAVLIILGFATWLLLISAKFRNHLLDMLSWTWPGIFCVIFLVLYSVLGYDCTIDLNNMIFIIVIATIFIFYLENSPDNTGRGLLKLCIADIIIACLFSIYRLIEHPEISRYLSTGHAYEYTNVDVRGVVSFGVVYGIVYAFPILIDKIVQKNTNKKFVWLLAMIVFLLTIVLAQFTISIFLCVFSFAVYFFLKKSKNKSPLFRRVILILMSFLAVFSFEGILAIVIEKELFPYEVHARLEEIYMFFNSNTIIVGSDIFSRVDKYTTSINTFFSNYMLGKAMFGNGTIGGHSEILDTLAEYGLIYFVLWVCFFKNIYNRILKILTDNDAQCFKMCVLLFVIGSFINTSLWSPTIIILVGVGPLLLINTHNETSELNEGIVN